MNFIPGSDFKSSISTHQTTHTSNAVPSLPDKLRSQDGGCVPMQMKELSNAGKHPLESRITNWNNQQEQLKLQQYKQIFGLAEPMKRVVEAKIIDSTDSFKPLLTDSNATSIHQDIVKNKEFDIEWEDVYNPSTNPDCLSTFNTINNNVHTKIENHLGL